jgi:hypothetical protein
MPNLAPDRFPYTAPVNALNRLIELQGGGDDPVPPYNLSVALGRVPGAGEVAKFGRNPDLDPGSVPEDIWSNGGVYTGHNVNSAQPVQVFSSSAADNGVSSPAGTGARTVVLEGLRLPTSTAYETDTITLNGTTPVLASINFYRINRAWVTTAGSNQANVGTITIRQSITTSNVLAIISPEIGQTQIAAFTVPDQTDFLIVAFEIQLVRASGSAGSGTLAVQTREYLSGSWRTRRNYALSSGAPISDDLQVPLVVGPQHDIRLRCTQISDTNTIITGLFSGFLIARESGA